MKKIHLISTFLLVIPSLAIATPPTQQKVAPAKQAAPSYIKEAPLPKGWPQPGPYDEVSEKSFPPYRSAHTAMSSENFAFWRLFRHIKRNNIPMTSPVEMGVEENGDKLSMKSMAFLYQSTAVGQAGEGGKKVDVKDSPTLKTRSYTWQGGKSSANLKKAKNALDTELEKRKLKSDDYRVMGYNSPSVPNAQKTWEMIVILPTAKQ